MQEAPLRQASPSGCQFVSWLARHQRRLLRQRCRNLLPDEMECAVEQRAEFLRVDHFQRARTWQCDGNHFLYSTGARGYHDYFITEKNGFLDGVGNEQYCLVRAIKDFQ